MKTILREEIESNCFPIYLNGKMYKSDWLKPIPLRCKSYVDVGIDQSSTCTGITIQGEDLLFICELPRNKSIMTVNTYKRALIAELHTLLRNLRVDHFIYEKHNRHFSELESVIHEVTKEIKSYCKKYKNLEAGINIHGILPGVWRSGFLPKEEYKNRFNRSEVKLACVEQAIKMNPDLEIYKKWAFKDYDGFESYGIINGYLNLNYDKNYNRIVNTSMDKINRLNPTRVITKCSQDNLEETINYIKEAYCKKFDCAILLGNNEILLEESCRRVLSEFNECIIVMPSNHPEIPSFILETRETYYNGDLYLIYTERG